MSVLSRCSACGVLRNSNRMKNNDVTSLVLCLPNQRRVFGVSEQVFSSSGTVMKQENDVIVCDVCTWCRVPSVCIQQHPGVPICVLCLEILQTNHGIGPQDHLF